MFCYISGNNHISYQIHIIGIFGKRVAQLRIIEFQKKGLPHAHVLVILRNDFSIKTPHQIDEMFSAEIPPLPPPSLPTDTPNEIAAHQQMTRLRESVLKHMIHGPCGVLHPTAPCMYDKMGQLTTTCHKSFPKDFNKETVWDKTRTYATYRRRYPSDGGVTAMKNNKIVTNAYVVPYSPYLILKYNCHINTEVCSSTKATKYLYNYVTKGGDRASITTTTDFANNIVRNEIAEYQDMRSIGASEATWRTFEFPIGKRCPAVKK